MTENGYWGMGAVVHGAGGSLGQSRSSEVFRDSREGERRLHENSPVVKSDEDTMTLDSLAIDELFNLEWWDFTELLFPAQSHLPVDEENVNVDVKVHLFNTLAEPVSVYEVKEIVPSIFDRDFSFEGEIWFKEGGQLIRDVSVLDAPEGSRNYFLLSSFIETNPESGMVASERLREIYNAVVKNQKIQQKSVDLIYNVRADDLDQRIEWAAEPMKKIAEKRRQIQKLEDEITNVWEPLVTNGENRLAILTEEKRVLNESRRKEVN